MISKLNQFTRSNKTHRLNTRVVLTVLIRATIMANTRAALVTINTILYFAS